MAAVFAGNSMDDVQSIGRYELDPALVEFIPDAFPWCWKRDGEKDGQPYNRIVFYRPNFDYDDEEQEVVLRDVEFYYRHEGPTDVIQALAQPLIDNPEIKNLGVIFSVEETAPGVAKLTITKGALSLRAHNVIADWSQERPKDVIPQGHFPEPTQDHAGFLKADYDNIIVYAGSGVSYESGLPTLAAIHEYFHVDSMEDGTFTFGEDDNLPTVLADDPMAFFEEGFKFYMDSANAQPSAFHQSVAHSLQSPASTASAVLTDNLDRVFEKTGITPERVRTVLTHDRGIDFRSLEGLENTPTFEKSALLVAGIAADRRGIIKAAREQGMDIIVVNPFEEVSPHAQNMSYIKPEDTWFRQTAGEFTADVAAAMPNASPKVKPKVLAATAENAYVPCVA